MKRVRPVFIFALVSAICIGGAILNANIREIPDHYCQQFRFHNSNDAFIELMENLESNGWNANYQLNNIWEENGLGVVEMCRSI